ncbi:MAG TPA: hypothetical protein VFX22_12035 [Candidatus Kapabacteria bacterium]|nr:hypothetical protein [Candidatus Kapabacteria bacterium]
MAGMSKKAVERLGLYYYRADLMHAWLHALRERYNHDLEAMSESDDWYEFTTYVDFWLAALFVLVEGFNKLGLKDKNVSKLFTAQIGLLKTFRHHTYHFVPEYDPESTEVFIHLNWAEELHDAIGDFLVKSANKRVRKNRRRKKVRH